MNSSTVLPKKRSIPMTFAMWWKPLTANWKSCSSRQRSARLKTKPWLRQWQKSRRRMGREVRQSTMREPSLDLGRRHGRLDHEPPREHERLALDLSTRFAVGGAGRGIIVVREYPHSVAAPFASQVAKRLHQRGAYALSPVSLVDRELQDLALGVAVVGDVTRVRRVERVRDQRQTFDEGLLNDRREAGRILTHRLLQHLDAEVHVA